MLLTALYLALLTVCLALDAVRPGRTRTRAIVTAERGDHGRGAAFAARARMADYQRWSWGGAARQGAYGPAALGAMFVLLDLSRLAHEAPALDGAPASRGPALGQDALALAQAGWASVHEDVLLASGLSLEAAPAAALAAGPLDAHDPRLAWEALHAAGHGAFVHDGWMI